MGTNLISVSRDRVEARINELAAELEAEQAKLLEFVPVEPVNPGSVVRFKQYGYDWAAIKTVTLAGYDRWFVTQNGSRSPAQGVAPKLWSQLLDWIGEKNWDSIEVLS